jgi:hypothetical protein
MESLLNKHKKQKDALDAKHKAAIATAENKHKQTMMKIKDDIEKKYSEKLTAAKAKATLKYDTMKAKELARRKEVASRKIDKLIDKIDTKYLTLKFNLEQTHKKEVEDRQKKPKKTSPKSITKAAPKSITKAAPKSAPKATPVAAPNAPVVSKGQRPGETWEEYEKRDMEERIREKIKEGNEEHHKFMAGAYKQRYGSLPKELTMKYK